ncbi:MAG: alpha/beta fold hydrolase [Cyclobacteriaceae bacterium]|nr:alpha/beta fold hydrolase [Cyclobacteriaceae bacterium]
MSHYDCPPLLFNRHLETIYPALFRTVNNLTQPARRERIATPDEDFLDIDWYESSPSHLVIISHGLEGNSTRAYVTGMARMALQNSWSVLCWNYRGCSGVMNRQRRFYHSGATDDLDTVVQYAIYKGYTSIALIGFSLGGNITLKYLGETSRPGEVKRGVAISAPVHLGSSCDEISKTHNTLYARRFLKSLKEKVRAKSNLIPLPGIDLLPAIRTLRSFDDVFTGPLHGFRDAADYYEKCSSLYYLKGIKVPALLLNAKNDPFLSPRCFPDSGEINNPFITFDFPLRGGHVGFAQFGTHGVYWSEQRTMAFLQDF